jgi:undecaprenyl diphosphate synthase
VGARHVAIIADGNRRWARRRGLPVAAGHAAAADTLRVRISDAIALGIAELSVFVFSTENWSRPADEVRELMDMFATRIATEAPQLHCDGVRMLFIGRREGLAEQLLAQMDYAEAMTAENTRLTLLLAFNYGGRAEILDAARRFDGGGEEEFARCTYAPPMHDPDVIIRTGGEQRLSNFLLWQSAYAELIFSEELWPDFDRACLERSLQEFAERRRRFGGRE